MEEKWNSRTELLIGKQTVKKLEQAKVIVYGIGGVGSFAVEALARAGVGRFVLVDNDVISISNLNRQIHANIDTIGKRKIDVMKQRILKINPNAKVDIYLGQELEKGEEELIDSTFSYVIDAVDTVSTKLKLILKANELNVPIISAMGTGNKLNPTKLEITDIYKTSVCPLCKIIRKELKKKNVKKLKVVYSKENPKKIEKTNDNNKKTIASISFMPSVAGLYIAYEVVKDIIEINLLNNKEQ